MTRAFAQQAAAPVAGDSAKSEALTLYKTGKFDAAAAAFLPLANAGDAEAAYHLGRIALYQSRVSDAVKWLEKAVKADDRNSRYHRWLGEAYNAQRERSSPLKWPIIAPKVKAEFERAVALDPTNVGARLSLAGYYLYAPGIGGGSVPKAREQSAAIARINPYRAQLFDAEMARHLKDPASAERILRGLMLSHPDSSPVVELARLYEARAQYEQAFAVLEERLQRGPVDAATLMELGRVAILSKQRLDRGQWAYEQLLLLRPAPDDVIQSWGHFCLGQIHEAQGDKTAARREYETAVRLNPNSEHAKQALKRLR